MAQQPVVDRFSDSAEHVRMKVLSSYSLSRMWLYLILINGSKVINHLQRSYYRAELPGNLGKVKTEFKRELDVV